MRALSRLVVCLALASVAVFAIASGGMCAVRYVTVTGDDCRDGTSWSLAVRTVQTAIDASDPGDEVWVAAGVYVEAIALRSGVKLYGGFSGSETARDQRDWRSNASVLQSVSRAYNPAVTATECDASSAVDGFRIRGGSTGILCASSSLTISHNVIYGNGGGIQMDGTGSALVTNNVIGYNSTWGIYVSSSACAPLIACNTVLRNATGLKADTSASRLSGNIVTQCQVGIFTYVWGFTGTISYNCVYNPGGTNYSGVGGGSGGIQVDPKLVSAGCLYARLAIDSPCINAGPTSGSIGSTDFDGRPRVQQARADMGAYESDGTAPAPPADPVVRVTRDGSDLNDGSGWDAAHAMQSLQSALYRAPLLGGEVWAQEGVWSEAVALPGYQSIFGGFSGTESARDPRNPSARRTIIDRRADTSSSSAVVPGSGACVDGLTVLCNYQGIARTVGARVTNCYVSTASTATGSSAIACSSGCTVAGNVVAATGNYGILATTDCVVVGNTVVGDQVGPEDGVYADNPTCTIAGNIVAYAARGVGVNWSFGGTLVSANNCLFNAGESSRVLDASTGTILSDPLFADSSTGNYCLSAASPCIDTGWSGTSGLPVTTIDGDPRVVGSGQDIGAHEYVASRTASPSVSPIGGMFGAPVNVAVTCATPGAEIHYTVNGGEPSGSDPVIASGGTIKLENTGILRVKAFADGLLPSPTQSGAYALRCENPTLRETDAYGSPDKIGGNATLVCGTAGAVIHYTTDGSDPTQSDPSVLSGGTVTISQVTVVKARAFAPDLDASDVVERVYRVRVRPPIFAPESSGPYTAPDPLTVSCATPGAVIRYTTDGRTPTLADPVVGPDGVIAVDTTCTVNARAWKLGMDYSSARSQIISFKAATPTLSPGETVSAEPVSVVIECSSPGVQIHYTTNDVDPAETDPMVASGGSVQIGSTCVLKAKAFRGGWTPSAVATAMYVIGNGHAVTYVKPTGSDANSGSSWALAKQTIQAAMDAASANSEIWVAAGTYHGCIAAKSSVSLYGGFTGTESDSSQRNPAANVTTLDGDAAGSVVTIPDTALPTMRIDGFTIRNGSAVSGGGIYCMGGSPVISGNTITANTADARSAHSGGDGGGIYVAAGSPTIELNTISGNHAYAWAEYVSYPGLANGTGGNGAGIYCATSTALIHDNTLTSNTCYPVAVADHELNIYSFGAKGAAICCGAGSPTVEANLVQGNTPGTDGYGDYGTAVACSSGCVNRNVVSANSGRGILADHATASGNVISENADVGLWLSYSVGANNTIVGNTVGVRCAEGATLSNSIVAFNAVGVASWGSGTMTLQNNCIFGNGSANYATGVTPGATDIQTNPLLVDQSAGNYHLSAESPCVNAGSNTAPGLTLVDIDGQQRIMGGTVDIGADERCQSLADAKRAPEGSPVDARQCVVTATFDGFFYIESADRSSGIRVDKADHGMAVGSCATVAGTVAVNSDGERLIAATSAVADGSGSILPLGIAPRSLSIGAPGSGLDSTGLLVRVWGRVSGATSTTFTIDDGSGRTVECLMPSGSTPDPAWQYVSVTGISSCKKVGDEVHSLLRVRAAGDVVRVL